MIRVLILMALAIALLVFVVGGLTRWLRSRGGGDEPQRRLPPGDDRGDDRSDG